MPAPEIESESFQSVFIEQIIPFNEKGIHPREKFVEYRFFQVKIYGSGIISVQQDLVRTARNMERFQQLVEQFSLRWIQHIRLVQQNDAPGGGGRAPGRGLPHAEAVLRPCVE